MAVAFGVAAFALAGRHPQYALLAICLGGASLAFLCFNFKNPPGIPGRRRLAVPRSRPERYGTHHRRRLQAPGNFLVALVIFAVRFTDTVTRQLSRWVSGGSVFDVTGSTDHLSHRLVARGFSPPEVAALHGIAGLFATAAAGISALYLLATPMLLTLGAFVAFGLAFVWDARRESKRPEEEKPKIAAERLAATLPIEGDPIPAGKPV